MEAPKFMFNIDWPLLRQQKEQLLDLAEANNEDLHGIVFLIDAIQDYAVDEMKLSKKTVFGK